MTKFVFALALLACVALEALCAPADPKAEENQSFRLKETAIPKKYEVHLTLTEKSGSLEKKFKGVVKIFFEKVDDDTISLHRSEKISISKITSCKKPVVMNDFDDKYDPVTEIMMIPASDCATAAADDKFLEIEYEGELYEDMYGFYISTITTGTKTYTFATTQFQGPYARRAFPCLDEPSFKAKFDITITHPDNYVAISNQVAEESCSPNTQQDAGKACTKSKFGITPTMPTYLVAFIVYPKEAIICEDVNEIVGNTNGINTLAMKVCAPTHLKDTMKFAKEETRPIINHLNEITKISYNTDTCPANVCDCEGATDPCTAHPTNMCDCEIQMEQLNQVAIPDFAAGAMENWGLVTYRETALLYDDKESTWRDKQRIATVIAHEFAHMWFGDLVTLKWWEYTWLNEGFARYFEYHVINDLKNDWKMADQFVIEQMHSIFQQDVKGALSLTSSVDSPAEVSAKFGSITYNKGACILRMLERALSEETCGTKDCNYFLESLNKYLDVNRFKNTVPDQLYEAFKFTLQNSNSILKDDIKKFMDSWTTHHGYPLVTVSISDKKLALKQEIFKYSEDDDSSNVWHIPITYYFDKETPSTKPTFLLKKAEDKIAKELTDEQLKKFVIVNVGQTGYYRVNYEGVLFTLLKNGLNAEDFSGIGDINRAQIVDDIFNLARVGKVSYKNAFDMIAFLEKDTSYFSWYASFNGFSYLRRRLPSSTVKNDITNLLKDLMKKVYEEVKKFEDDNTETSQIEMYKKILVLQWACEINLLTCREDALTMFNEREGKKEETGKATPTKTPANLRKIVYCEAARKNIENWETLWKEYKATTSAANKVTIITALGCSENDDKLKSYLDLSITENSGIRSQDAYSVFTAVLTGNPKGVDICLNFLIEKYDKIRDRYVSMNALSTVITSVADRITTDAQSAKFLKFLTDEEANLEDAKLIIPVARSTVESNKKWVDKYEKILVDTFNPGKGDDDDGAANSIFAFSLSVLLFVALSVNALF